MRVLDCNYFISNNKSGKKFFYWQIRLQLIFINFKIRLKIQSLITHKIRQFYGDELLQRSRLRLMSLNSFAVSLSCLDTRQKKTITSVKTSRVRLCVSFQHLSYFLVRIALGPVAVLIHSSLIYFFKRLFSFSFICLSKMLLQFILQF